MLDMVADWQLSGKSKKQYCRDNDIVYSKFHYWFSRSKDGLPGPARFVALEQPTGKGNIEVIYPNGVRLKVDGDLGLLSRLIHLY